MASIDKDETRQMAQNANWGISPRHTNRRPSRLIPNPFVIQVGTGAGTGVEIGVEIGILIGPIRSLGNVAIGRDIGKEIDPIVR